MNVDQRRASVYGNMARFARLCLPKVDLPNSLIDDRLFLVVNRVQAHENAALAVKVVDNVTHLMSRINNGTSW